MYIPITQSVTFGLDVSLLSKERLEDLKVAVEAELERREDKSLELRIEERRAARGSKIMGIKMYCNRTGASFKDSLAVVEKWLADDYQKLGE